MNIPTDTHHAQHEHNRNLVHTLERIRTELGLNESAWADFLQLKINEYEKVRKGHKPLSVVSLYHVSQKLALDPAALLTGKIDYAALVQAHFGNRSYLRPDYQIAASSRKFTVVNTLNYVQKFRGAHLRVAANRHFQIHEDYWIDWQDPNSSPINIRFLGELWAFLKSRGLTDEDFRSIGFHSVLTFKKTHIGRKLASFARPQDVYACLISDIMDNIEQNHLYRITRLSGEVCVIESRTNPEVAEALGIYQTGSLEGCQVKIGLISSMPTFTGHPAASVHETNCVHRGDSVCRFFCDFSKSKIADHTDRRISLLS